MKLSKIISVSDIERCPRGSLSPGHYKDDGSCLCTPEPAGDDTAPVRKAMIDGGQPAADLAADPDRKWTTAQLQEEFEVLEFSAPFVVVRRKSDQALGSMEFTHSPRVYFGWSPHEDESE
jgi:hypothetical protein